MVNSAVEHGGSVKENEHGHSINKNESYRQHKVERRKKQFLEDTRYDTIYISPPNMQNLPKLFKDKYKCDTIETKIQFKTMVASGVRQGTEVRRGTARVFIYFSSLNLR